MNEPTILTSLQNPRVKDTVRLRNRRFRDEQGLLLIEGYREILRALDNSRPPSTLFFCPPLFLGENENELIRRCRDAGALTLECSREVFQKMAYRDRPDGLLAVAPQQRRTLADLLLPENPLLLIAESIEKPGNLGTILRTADAAGAHAVIVCDPCTDIHNPNVVRASIGTLFCVPVVEATTAETVAWARARGIATFAATPHTDRSYTDADFRGPSAIIVGSEQYGLRDDWLKQADHRIRIPMRGQADSLNVSAAATILLFEALRQRMTNGAPPPPESRA